MYDKEADLIFESYVKTMDEAWELGDDHKLSDDRIKFMDRPQYGNITQEDVDKCISLFKAKLKEQEKLEAEVEKKHGTAAVKGVQIQFRDDDNKERSLVHIFASILRSELTEKKNFYAARAVHAARAILNELKTDGKLNERLDGTVDIVDTNIDDVDDELEDVLGVDDKPAVKPQIDRTKPGFRLSEEFKVDRDIPADVSEEAKEAHAALLDAGMAFGDHTGKELVKTSGLAPLEVAYAAIRELIDRDVILSKDADNETEDVVDVGDEIDDETADKDFIDRTVQSAEWGNERPAMRPDDF